MIESPPEQRRPEIQLAPALPGERLRIRSSSGDLNVYCLGDGAPLLLIHSINAAASAAEVRPLQEHFSTHRRVFCPDLPGYGLSERSDLPYSPRRMTDAIIETVRLIQATCGTAPIDALALSLSSEYLARAALDWPGAFRSVSLVSPTGLSGRVPRRGPPGSERGIPWLYRLLRGRSDGEFWFRQLTRPGVIRYFLGRTWGSKHIDEELWRYDCEASRQPGAQFAPLRFLGGYLFSGDIHTIYEALTLPVWMCHGVRGDFTDYRNQKIVAGRSNWSFTVYPTGALPHFELPQVFCADYERFMAQLRC